MADNTTRKDAAAATITMATDDIGGIHYQRFKRSVGPDGSATDYLDHATQAVAFTTTGDGAAINVNVQAMKHWSMQIKGTGTAPTSFTVNLQLSLDGVNFRTFAVATNLDPGDGGIVSVPFPAPALYAKVNCSALVLGSATNIVVTLLGVP